MDLGYSAIKISLTCFPTALLKVCGIHYLYMCCAAVLGQLIIIALGMHPTCTILLHLLLYSKHEMKEIALTVTVYVLCIDLHKLLKTL